MTTETFGITCEYIICKLYDLQVPEHIKKRSNEKYFEKYSPIIDNILKESNITPLKALGYKNGCYDFILENEKTLSVKTNVKGIKICPQNIGQLTRKKFDEKFNLKNKNDLLRKEFIIKNIHTIIKIYFDNLFCCDYLLYISPSKSFILNKKDVKYIKFLNENFTFTRYLNSWNESTTLKYNKISIGEFQFHKNRDCIKFRFHFNNLLKLIEL
jgi:hypothetical protein